MPERLEVAVVGAGPFGLSVAAHLADRPVRVFGEPLATWRFRMPPGMRLRSAWEETSLSTPDGQGTLDRWLETTGEKRVEPIPLESFLRYGEWFRSSFVSDVDPTCVRNVDRDDGGYRLETAAGGDVLARNVVLAVGVTPFVHVPRPLAELLGDCAQVASEAVDLSRYGGRRVLVVGGGQAGLESAGLAAQAGAQVELVTRSRVRWFADREPHHPRGPLRRRLYRLAYPAVGYGPPPLNRLVLHPDRFASLPPRLRGRLSRRLLRSGGSPWIRDLVRAHVRLTEGTTVASAEDGETGLRITLEDGSAREVDDVLVACGYRFSLERLGFLSQRVQASIAVSEGWPVLDRGFRSTARGLFFVGYPAEGLFGPISRFVLGTKFTASRLRAALDADRRG